MSTLETYIALDNEIKIDELLSNGELIDGYKDGNEMVYHFLLNDFFVTMRANETTDETVMKVSRSSSLIDQHLAAIDLAELF